MITHPRGRVNRFCKGIGKFLQICAVKMRPLRGRTYISPISALIPAFAHSCGCQGKNQAGRYAAGGRS